MSEEYIASLEATLKLITLPDTATVKQASAKLSKEFYNSPDSLPAMIHILQKHPEEQIRQLAAIEARKLVIKHWTSLDASVKASIRTSILDSTLKEQSKVVTHNAARVVSSIGERDLETNEWPDLLNVLVSNASGSDVGVKETSVYIIYALLETYSEPLIQHSGDFLTLFSSTLRDNDSLEVRVHSLLALSVISTYLEDLEDSNDKLATEFKSLIHPMVDVLKAVIVADDLASAKLVFGAFSEFAFYDPKLVGDNILLLIKVFVEIALAESDDADNEYKLMALQFLVRMVPLKKSKIISNKLGPELTLAGLKLAADAVDEDEELDESYEENENEESNSSSLALRLLAELSNELPPSQVITPILNQLPTLMGSSSKWDVRAALLSLGVIAPGAPDFITNYLAKLVPTLVSGLEHNDPIVKLAALRTISELTGELQNTLAEYYQGLLPILINVIDSSSYPVIYKYGVYALDGIIEYMDHDAIGGYLEPLMNKLIQMLQTSNSASLKTAVVSAIGSTAFAAGKAFTTYFDQSLQLLEPLIQMTESTENLDEDQVELKASTFENVSTMARAVGAQSFAKFAEPLINSAYVCINSDNARLRESGFTFINNMAKVYGEDFGAFLPKLIPALIKCLEQQEMTFNLNEDVSAEEEDEGYNSDDIDDKYGIHTGITMEKEIACIALAELASATKSQFGEYVEKVVEVLLEQVESSFSINTTALSTLWKIIAALYKNTCAEKSYPIGAVNGSYVPENLLAIIKVVREKTIELLVEEFEISDVHIILSSLTETFKDIGAITIMDNGDSSSLEKLCIELMKLFKGEHNCQGEEEKEEGEEIEASESEVLLFDSSLDILTALALTLGNDFNRILLSFKDIIYKTLSSKSKNKRSAAVGALSEIAEGLKDQNEFVEEFLTHFAQSLEKDSFLDVKSNAAYGIGTVIFNSPRDLSSIYPNVLNSLSKLLNKAEKEQNRNFDDEETKDIIDRSYSNACGCVARMALKNPSAVPLDQIVPVLLAHLPLVTAFEENVPIFNLIIKLYQSNPDLIQPHTEKIITIFAAVFQKDQERIKLENESTLGREQNIDSLKQFQADGLKEQVVELLKYIESKHAGSVSSNSTLASVIA